MSALLKLIRVPITLLAVFTLLLGGVYSAFVTVTAQQLFSHRASGSLVRDAGKTIGSELLGQHFEEPGYFWGRLSMTTLIPYNAAASGGSNMSPANPQLHEAVNRRVEALKKHAPDTVGKIPVDLVTASASGLDPHISLAAALYQVPRIARARNAPQEQLMELIHGNAEQPLLGFIGDAKVNVLQLNRLLDALHPPGKKEKR